MLFKWSKRHKGKDGSREVEEKGFISTDTKLGRFYNERLNKHYTEALYSDALSYEMHHLLEQRVDVLEKRVAILEAEIESLK